MPNVHRLLRISSQQRIFTHISSNIIHVPIMVEIPGPSVLQGIEVGHFKAIVQTIIIRIRVDQANLNEAGASPHRRATPSLGNQADGQCLVVTGKKRIHSHGVVCKLPRNNGGDGQAVLS